MLLPTLYPKLFDRKIMSKHIGITTFFSSKCVFQNFTKILTMGYEMRSIEVEERGQPQSPLRGVTFEG